VSSFGAAVADDWLYVYGGHSGRTHQYSTEAVVGTFHRLKLSDPRAWEELPGGPIAQGLALVAHGGKLYRIGGMQPRNKPGEPADNHSLATCARYDPATRKWEALPDLPAGRSSHDAVVLGDRIVVVGGWRMTGAGTKPTWHDTALVLDLNDKPLRWRAIAQPFRRRALTAAAHDGKVFILGGLTDEGEMDLGVDVYDPKRGSWTTGPSLPGPIRNGFTPASCVAGGRLFVSTADGKVSRLSEKGNAWEEVGRLRQPRSVHRMVSADEELLVAVGGASRAGNVALTEAIEPACCVKPTETKPAAAGKQVLCPVMTSVPVDGDSAVVEYRGVKVFLCCRACVRKWNADPEAYLNAKLLPQLAGAPLPERALKQVYCPVYRDRVVSAKDPYVMYRGEKVYLFNQNAVRRWKQDPQKYADPRILPQLGAR
jgi:YHS domain-containing protein